MIGRISDRLRPRPMYAGTYLLSAGDFRIEVMQPDSPERYNCGVRFTPVAAVLRAYSSGGNEWLYHKQEHDPLKDHCGLSSEFDLNSPPPGFTQAEQGGPFMKIGVGILRKHGSEYQFWSPYEPLALARTSVAVEKSAARFIQECPAVEGLGYSLSCSLFLEPYALRLDWRLENTGQMSFSTQAYTHNYFSFNQCPCGFGYRLDFPYPVSQINLRETKSADALETEPRQEEDAVISEGNSLIFQNLDNPQPLNISLPYPHQYDGSNSVTLLYQPKNMSVECLTSRPGLKTNIYANSSYICPEQFIGIALDPGETASWTRTYLFRK